MSSFDGLANLCTVSLENSTPSVTIFSICDMTELVLKRNVFQFSMEYFIHTSGTAIGTKQAPSRANLFLSVFEHALLGLCPIKPSTWLRYIDGIFVVWTKSEDKLTGILIFINTVIQVIQFRHVCSFESVIFLDFSVSLVVMEPFQLTYVQNLQTHISILIWASAILVIPY